jgi:hypothetical protein
METLLDMSTLVIEECCNCHIRFGMPSGLQSQRRDDHKSFYCPNGHGQHYTSESDAERLARQLRAARSDRDWYQDQLGASERSKAALKGHLTRARNKIAAGTCPVADCGMHFSNVREHMKHKHPDFALIDPETGEPATL